MNANASRTDRPNIVLINCDDLGYGDLGCYGSRVNATPALDRLAAEGVRLTDFYMASPVCSPSRGAMMTGCYPSRIGFDLFTVPGRDQPSGVLFPGSPEGLHADELTMAQLLKRAGYATGMVGKWHCGDQPEFLPTNRGFDSYYGLPYSNDMGRQCHPTRADWPPLPLVDGQQVIEQQPDQESLTERYVERCVRFIRDNAERPFFLYLAHMHVHVPIYVSPRFRRQARNGPYGAAVECVDWSVAVLTHELRRLGLEDNTVVIFTSDNGSKASDSRGGSNAPLRGTKASCWEGGQRVPCIVRWPAKIPTGSVCRELATAMDLLPTFANWTGQSLPADRPIDGRDISALLTGQPDARSPHEAFFYSYAGRLTAVRAGRWKLHCYRDGRQIEELYDLQADVGEKTNLAANHPDVVAELRQRLDAHRLALGDRVTGTVGQQCRPAGVAANAVPLTQYDPDYPYIIAEYDLPDCG